MQNEASQPVHMETWANHVYLLSTSIKCLGVGLCLSLLAASNLFIKFAVYGGTTGYPCKPIFSPCYLNILDFRKKKRGKQVGEGGRREQLLAKPAPAHQRTQSSGQEQLGC